MSNVGNLLSFVVDYRVINRTLIIAARKMAVC
jgi:hypothetical protein